MGNCSKARGTGLNPECNVYVVQTLVPFQGVRFERMLDVQTSLGVTKLLAGYRNDTTAKRWTCTCCKRVRKCNPLALDEMKSEAITEMAMVRWDNPNGLRIEFVPVG